MKNTLYKKALRWGGLDMKALGLEVKMQVGRKLKFISRQTRFDSTDYPIGLPQRHIPSFQRAGAWLWSASQEKRKVYRPLLPVMQREMGIRELLNIESHKGEFVGVEIEFLLPRQVNSSTLRTSKFIALGSDGSICPPSGFIGLEANVVYVRGVSENRLEKFCHQLSLSQAQVNKSCGLHIHLDQRNVSRATAWRRYHRLVSALPWLKLAVPPSRMGNSYCRLNVAGENPENYDRYMAINWKAYTEHGTIEVRLLNGTTSADKIKHWVALCVGASRNTLPTIDAMMNCNEIPREAKEWFMARKRKFYPDNTASGMNEEGSEE
jgi:hypothetical protein